VGNSQVLQLSFANQGGAGRFQLVPASCWPEGWQAAQAEEEAQLSDAFKVRPSARWRCVQNSSPSCLA
jgi:hypothetical protein